MVPHHHHLPTTTTTFLLPLLIITLSFPVTAQNLSYFDQWYGAVQLVRLASQDHDVISPSDQATLTSLLALEGAMVRQAVRDSVDSLSGNFEVRKVRSSEDSEGQSEGEGSNVTCLNYVNATVVALMEGQTWALQMVDAMGKPSPAVLEGNTKWPGDYGQCQRVRANTSLPDHPTFSGKYCNVFAVLQMQSSLNTPIFLQWGFCAPDTCSEGDMSLIVFDVLQRLQVNLTVTVSCPEVNRPIDAKGRSGHVSTALAICSLLLLLLVVGTVADLFFIQRPKWRQDSLPLYTEKEGEETAPLLTNTSITTDTQQDPGVCIKLLTSFSVYTNGAKLLSTSQAPGSLTCVHGIRFLSMTWVVLGHGFLFPSYNANNVMPYLKTAIKRWTFQAVVNAPVSVDSFFVLSGLLVAYLTLRELKKNKGKLNWFMFYFHRFWRLTPPYMLIIMVNSWLSRHWSEGPFAPADSSYDSRRDGCAWWANLLYINNFVKTEEACLGQSWYLANDMQFYCILSPLVILPLFHIPVVGLVISAVLVLVSCITSGVLVSVNDFAPGMYAQVQSNHTDMESWYTDYYIKPYTRMGPYVLGMLAGYFLYRYKGRLDIRWHTNLCLWSVATGCALAVLYGLYDASTGHPMTVPVSALYTALHRNVWGACLCWVIIACVTGNAGFVNTLLSWSAFVPLSRLTYCIYLLHLMMIQLYLSNMQTAFYLTDINVVAFFIFILVVSYMAALVASLAFEAPMMMLEKVVFKRQPQRLASELTSQQVHNDVRVDNHSFPVQN